MDLEIKCKDCGAVVTHVCRADLRAAFVDLYVMTIGHYGFANDAVIAASKEAGYYEQGDEKAPFFSESYLYSMLGKEDARSVLVRVKSVVRAAGFDLNDIEREVWARLAKSKEGGR